jgi:two-component system phosphate regulon sensor histidine kinase PhoR
MGQMPTTHESAGVAIDPWRFIKEAAACVATAPDPAAALSQLLAIALLASGAPAGAIMRASRAYDPAALLAQHGNPTLIVARGLSRYAQQCLEELPAALAGLGRLDPLTSVADLALYTSVSPFAALLEEGFTAAFIATLGTPEHPQGYLVLWHRNPGYFDRADQHMLAMLVAQCSAVIQGGVPASLEPEPPAHHESAMLALTQLDAIRQLQRIKDAGQVFVAATDRAQVHHALIATLKQTCHFAACAILLFDNEGDSELTVVARHPLGAGFLHDMVHHVVRAAARISLPTLAPEPLTQTLYLDAPDDIADDAALHEPPADHVRSFMANPLFSKNKPIGLLGLADDGENMFNEEHLRFFSVIADYAAVALDNVRLREDERRLWAAAMLEHQRLELIIASMAEGLIIVDEVGRITHLNPVARSLLALATPDAREWQSLAHFSGQSDAAWVGTMGAILSASLAGKVVMNHELLVGTTVDGAPLTLSISSAPCRDASGRLLGAVAVLNDITHTREIDKLKDEFVSVVSHELRTPLTSIKGYTQHLLRRMERQAQALAGDTGALSPMATYEYRSLSIIQSQAEHLERLVNDLLDLSHLQRGRLPLHPAPFKLSEILDEVVRWAQVSTEQHEIQLEIHADDTTVVGDRARIMQVAGNILDNALKYSPDGGVVRVQLDANPLEFSVSVTDQGMGVNPDAQQHIFDRFYRVNNLMSRQYSGIGLGLYVARAIIEAHGGRIWVESQEGQGSTFSFTLPRLPQAAPNASNSEGEDEFAAI